MQRLLTLGLSAALAFTAPAALAKDEPFRIAWTIYAGSLPLGYAEETGILDKWAERYDIEIEAVQLNDYIEAQNQYTAGAFDGVIAITLDALTIPAAGGVDSTAALLLNASNGSDGLIMKGTDKAVADLKDQSINLVEYSGSHYLLARALDENGMSERDVTVVNTSDADIIAAFQTRQSQAVVTWKPQLSEILEQNPESTLLFDSSDIPNEITDILLVHTQTLADYPELGKALAGAWYEVIDMLDPEHPNHEQAIADMAAAVQTDRAGFMGQIETINFFSPEEAAAMVSSDEFSQGLASMTEFAWDKGLLGEGASGPDVIGVEFPAGNTLGNPDYIKLRFPATFMESAKP